jgi:hypothetical protein
MFLKLGLPALLLPSIPVVVGRGGEHEFVVQQDLRGQRHEVQMVDDRESTPASAERLVDWHVILTPVSRRFRYVDSVRFRRDTNPSMAEPITVLE